MSGEGGKHDPKHSAPPPAPPSHAPGAAQVGQDLLAQLHNDFVVHKQPVPVSEANRGAQLGQDLLAQFAHDFGEKKRAQDAADLQSFGQQLLGAVARDFGSVRPPSIGAPPGAVPVIPGAPKVPSFAPPPVVTASGHASSSGNYAAVDVAPPPGYQPPAPRPVSLAAPPSAELLKAEEELAKIESAPLGKDEEAEVEAMQGKGALGFLKKLFKR
jgi:hypothetical protein